MYGVNKTLALAIVYEESGIMTSSLFRNSNNMGGLRGGSGWLKFPSLEAGRPGDSKLLYRFQLL